MIEVQTSTLDGKALNWAVSHAIGQDYYFPDIGPAEPNYVEDWRLSGPLLEGHSISVYELPSGLDVQKHPTFKEGDVWEAEMLPPGEDCIAYCGTTFLVAGLRCLVGSRIGEKVAVPATLLGQQDERKEYTFDVKLFATMRVKAATLNEARAILNEAADCLDCNGGAWPDGTPILFEAGQDGEADLIEIDGEPV